MAAQAARPQIVSSGIKLRLLNIEISILICYNIDMYHAESLPVLIAAHNEEDMIGRTLSRLPRDFNPIVISNGSTDATVEVASHFGGHVIDLDTPGKLPAQQEGVRYLRGLGHSATDPILFLDADSYPLFPKRWGQAMTERTLHAHTDQPAAADRPSFTSGLVGCTDGGLVLNVLRTAHAYKRTAAEQSPNNIHTVYGANMGIVFGTENVREEFLNMENVWPGEDRATAKLIINAGGNFRQLLHPDSLVLASTRYRAPLIQRLLHGRKAMVARYGQGYEDRRPPHVTHTFNGEEIVSL
jgi:glycosyltransferase involved in cell wall biosynthesis